MSVKTMGFKSSRYVPYEVGYRCATRVYLKLRKAVSLNNNLNYTIILSGSTTETRRCEVGVLSSHR